EDAVIVFDSEGRVVRTFGKQFKGGLHGMTIVKEGETEFLYLTHTARHEVVKATLEGEVVWTLGCPVVSGLYADPNKYAPTSVVVSGAGHIYVADGYGLSWIHQFDKERKYIRSFGGPGTEPGQLRTPHGLLIDTRTEPQTLLVADRENQRLQRFDLSGKHLEVISGMFRRPCNLGLKDGFLVVPDLAGRVTILNQKNELVAHLGDQPDPSKRARNGVAKDQWVVGQFLAPHGAAWGPDGHLYVLEWNKHGRIVKLIRQ
ncbi:MAG TPA: hypothetical protein PKA37_08230, partial [Planctomycetota bacterium]|nr:hypothetical protein [Planctomycetota bacterium]